MEEKFRKAMILNAQLDNDKASLGYQLELLKDRIDELQEEYAQLQVPVKYTYSSRKGSSSLRHTYLNLFLTRNCYIPPRSPYITRAA